MHFLRRGHLEWPIYALNSSVVIWLPPPDNEEFSPVIFPQEDWSYLATFTFVTFSSPRQGWDSYIGQRRLFLCCDGSLKEVRANDLSLWSQGKTGTTFSVPLRMGVGEMDIKASSRPTLPYVVPKAFTSYLACPPYVDEVYVPSKQTWLRSFLMVLWVKVNVPFYHLLCFSRSK